MATSTITVLFTDLVASTELSFRLGDRYDDVRRAHDELLRSAVASHGGTVVKGLGDGVMATFEAAGDAVAAARAVQRAIRNLNDRRGDGDLAVRVGLAAGDVTVDGGDCFGEPVVVAARLCSAADGRQILATETVRSLVGGRRAAGFRDAGTRALKGIPDPVDAVEVEWERPARSSAPVPARVAEVDATAFVGRAAELAELDAAYRSAVATRGRRVVLVGGEPGLGKTTLACQAALRWYDDGAAVGFGRCDEDVRSPYRPFVEALGPLVGGAPAEVLDAHVARHGGALATLVPALAERPGARPGADGADQESERYRLLSALDDLLAALGEVAPVVLVLDDLHWADGGTASLVRSVALGEAPARLVVVGTVRSDEVATDGPIGQAMASLWRAPAVSRLALAGLDEADVVALLGRRGDVEREVAERVAADVVAETGGNAFFVTELLREVADPGELDRAGGVLPDSVRAVLADRVARLGPVAAAALGAAAVIGSEFGVGLLAAVTGDDEGELLDVLRAASAAALVREVQGAPGRYRFAHALVQHAVLADLGGARSASLHRRVAEALEARGPDAPVAEVAHHWLRATLHADARRARDWARQAGEAALDALAPGDAVAHLRRALLLHDQLPDDDATRIDLLVELGSAERLAGDPSHRETLLQACHVARRAGDDARLAAAALATSTAAPPAAGVVDDERVEVLRAALDAGPGDRERALLLANLANELTYAGDVAARVDLARDAVRTARSDGDPALVLHALNLVFAPLWIPEALEERLAMAAERADLAPSVADPVVRCWAALANALTLVEAGRVAEADVQLADAGALAERTAQPGLRWRARHVQAARHLLAGDVDAAERARVEALELGELAGSADAPPFARAQRRGVLWLSGELGEHGEQVDGTRRGHQPAAVAARCLASAEAGRLDEAAAVLDAGARTGFAEHAHDPTWTTSIAMLAEGAVLAGHRAAAVTLHGLLAPYAGHLAFDGVTTAGSLGHHVGALAALLGRHDEAVDALRRAVEVHAAAGSPFFEARSRERLAAALLDRDAPGDRAAATAEAQHAALMAAARGYRLVHRRASALLG